MSRVGTLGVALALVAMPVGSAGQTTTSVGAGIEYQRVSFGEPEQIGGELLTLLAASWAARVEAGPRVELTLSGRWGRAEKIRADGSSISLSGLTDTELVGSLRLADGDVTLSGILALPTGSPELDPEELEVAANVASDLIPFRIANWGSGGGAGARVALARRFGTVGAGISAGYFVGREFTPLAFSEVEYRPASSFVLRGAMDRPVGRSNLSLQLTWRTYGTDQGDGGEIFSPGDRLQALLAYTFPSSARSTAALYLGALRRASSGSRQDEAGVGARTLLLAGGTLRVPGTTITYLPTIDLRLVRAEDGIDQGYQVGVGGRAEWDRGAVVVVPSVRLHLGHLAVQKDVAESGYVGLDVGLSMRFGR